jgi:hypothetical protein
VYFIILPVRLCSLAGYVVMLPGSPGMKVANVSFKKTGEHDTLIVERFDRKCASGHVKKRHIIDGCH